MEQLPKDTLASHRATCKPDWETALGSKPVVVARFPPALHYWQSLGKPSVAPEKPGFSALPVFQHRKPCSLTKGQIPLAFGRPVGVLFLESGAARDSRVWGPSGPGRGLTQQSTGHYLAEQRRRPPPGPGRCDEPCLQSPRCSAC